jgi:hypothetical protein
MKAACPACGQEIVGLDPTTDVVRCATCTEYAAVTAESLVPVRHDFVARAPTFLIPIERARLGLPKICAQCGAPGALDPVRLAVSVFGTQLDVDEPVQIVDVPHCKAHHEGAAPAPGAVRVRSHAHWLEAMAAGTRP